MKLKLSDEQKLQKKRRDTLQSLHNRLMMRFSLKQMRTWGEYYKETGQIPAETVHRNSAITVEQLREIFRQQKQELEEQIEYEQTNHNPSAITTNTKDISESTPRDSVVQSGQHQLATSTEKDSSRAEEVKLVGEEKIISEKRILLQEAIEQVYNEKNNYGLKDSPNESLSYFWFQKKAIAQCWHKITVEKRRGILLIASTGSGKTFMAGGVMRRLEDIKFHEQDYSGLGLPRTWSHIPYLYVTRASIVSQTERVLQKFFRLGKQDTEVINIEQLRSSAGRLWVTEKMEIRQGKEEYFWEWKNKINPCVIFWDECQALKNEGSTQHNIAAAYNDLPTTETYQVFISATPFTRVSEAKCFAVSTHKNIEHLGFPKGTILTNKTWASYASAIAAPSAPDEYNEAAVERLMKDLDEYVVQVKGVRPQFDAINTVQLIDLANDEEKKYYHEAWKRYQDEKAKLSALAMAEGKGGGYTLNELVAFQKFRMAAEFCRKEFLAKEMYNIVQHKGKAAICALNFKGSIVAIVKLLCEKYKVPRNKISLIWGGGQTELTTKQKNKKKVIELKDKFEAAGLSIEDMLKSLGLDDVEDRIIQELDPSLRLGNQSPEERQYEIDRFQKGDSLYCLFTFRAGGVGLSLHHTDEFSPVKVRHKESGYAFEEDIPSVPIRSRETLVAPTYSAIELVQGLGRAPRITSLSDTVQRLIFYRGTIESDVSAIVAQKLKCLSKVVRMREHWQDIVQDDSHRTELVEKHLTDTPDDKDNEDTGIGDIE